MYLFMANIPPQEKAQKVGCPAKGDGPEILSN